MHPPPGRGSQLVRFHRHSTKLWRKLETMYPTIQILSGGHQKYSVLLTVAGKGALESFNLDWSEL